MPPAMPNTPEMKDETRMVSPSRASVRMDIQSHRIGEVGELIRFAAGRKGQAASYAKRAEVVLGKGVNSRRPRQRAADHAGIRHLQTLGQAEPGAHTAAPNTAEQLVRNHKSRRHRKGRHRATDRARVNGEDVARAGSRRLFRRRLQSAY